MSGIQIKKARACKHDAYDCFWLSDGHRTVYLDTTNEVVEVYQAGTPTFPRGKFCKDWVPEDVWPKNTSYFRRWDHTDHPSALEKHAAQPALDLLSEGRFQEAFQHINQVICIATMRQL